MSLATQKFNIVKKILNKSMFNENIIHIILKYYWQLLDNKKQVLLDWIDYNKLHFDALSANSNAINILESRIKYEKRLSKKTYNNLIYYKKINWCKLSENPNAIDLLKNNQDKINWYKLSSNPNAINILNNNKDKIN